MGRLDRVRRVQKSSKNEKGFLFEKAAACNSLERLMPRDGIEPPTPAFSGQNRTFLLKCLTRWDVVIELCSEAVNKF